MKNRNLTEGSYLRLGEPLRWNRLGEIIRNDVFTGLQQSVMNFGILKIQGLVNSFGAVVMAAFAAAVKIDTLAYMPAQEFGNAYSLFISQNYGAQKRERIKKGTKLATCVSVVFCVVVSVFIFLTAKGLMKLFVDSTETSIIEAGVKYLRIEGSNKSSSVLSACTEYCVGGTGNLVVNSDWMDISGHRWNDFTKRGNKKWKEILQQVVW